MVQELTHRGLLELMPELKGAEVTIRELSGGITNRLYRVQASSGQDLVVRFYGEKTELFIDREMEMENLRRMAVSGVTPKLVRFLPNRRVTIVEFVRGYVLKNEDFLKEELWDSIIRSIKGVHQCKVVLPRVFDPLTEVKRLYGIFCGMHRDYPEFEIRGSIDVLEKIGHHARISVIECVPCHNDLLADNFILVENGGGHGRSIYLIDWEYGGMGIPYYDLADMFQEILVPRRIESELLRRYWEDRNVEQHTHMTDLFKPFPDIYWFLWSLIQLSISGIDFDYYNYGKIKYQNAWENIQYLSDHYGVRL